MTYEELLAQNKTQADQITTLQNQIAELQKLIFGSKRERFISDTSPEQLNIFSDALTEEQSAPEKEKISYERKKNRKHPGREKLPDHLPVEEVTIEPEGDLSEKRRIGEHVSETIKYIPGSLIRLRTIYPKYVAKNEAGEEQVIQAVAKSRAIPRCLAENSLLAHIIISKFIDHLPFYRQIQRFKRDYDWNLSKSTVNDWFVAVCTLLDPLYQSMKKKVKKSEYIQVDESHIKVQDNSKKGTTHMGWQWVYHAPVENIVAFQYRKGRGKNGPKEFLENYTGYLQCDGYGVYDKIGQLPKIDLVGCHVHARRYFIKAKDAGDQRAEFALNIYQNIYHHEKQCKDFDAEARKAYRLENIAPLLQALKTWVEEKAILVLPKSPLGKAIKYTIGQWPKLIAVLEDGKLQLDNNLIENKIRPLALGRKNYLFAGSHAAAQRIAMMYTFFATCKASEVNPYDWLKYTLDNIADQKIKQIEQFIPHKGMFSSENKG